MGERLTAQLTTDTAGAAGDHNGLPPQVVDDRFHIGLYTLAEEQVFNRNVTQGVLIARHEALEIDGIFEDAQADAQGFTDIIHVAHPIGVDRGDGDNHLSGAVFTNGIGQFLIAAHNGDAGDAHAVLGFIGIDGGHGINTVVMRFEQALNEHGAGIARTDHDGTLIDPVLRMAGGREPMAQTGDDADAHGGAKNEDGVDGYDRDPDLVQAGKAHHQKDNARNGG